MALKSLEHLAGSGPTHRRLLFQAEGHPLSIISVLSSAPVNKFNLLPVCFSDKLSCYGRFHFRVIFKNTISTTTTNSIPEKRRHFYIQIPERRFNPESKASFFCLCHNHGSFPSEVDIDLPSVTSQSCPESCNALGWMRPLGVVQSPCPSRTGVEPRGFKALSKQVLNTSMPPSQDMPSG